MPKIVRGTETNKWLPSDMRKCTIPILVQPGKIPDDIRGSAFLLRHNKKEYIVTARHVTEIKNPVLAFSAKTHQPICVDFSYFQKKGLSWVNHPKGLDLAVMPFLVPQEFVDKLDLWFISEDKWTTPAKINIADEVAHLGYPEKGTSNYLGGKPSLFPQGMPGKVIKINQSEIIMNTAAAHGASGGPVFLRRKDMSPFLVGVVTETRMYGSPTCQIKAEYRNKTTSLVISQIIDILQTKEMKLQFNKNKKNQI